MEPVDDRLQDESLPDAELARRIGAAPPGSAAGAEAELCRRLGPRARRYGLRHLRDAAAADDLAQQVLLMTLESLRAGRVREPEKLASFVLGTCRMVVQVQRRGEARRRSLLDRRAHELPAAAESPAPGPEPERLRGCLDRLSARERSVVVLSFYAESNAAEVGEGLGLSPGNVRVIRHRALGRLRRCLEGHGGAA